MVQRFTGKNNIQHPIESIRLSRSRYSSWQRLNDFCYAGDSNDSSRQSYTDGLLCLTINSTAQAKLTEREGEGNEQGEITRIEAKTVIIEQGENLKLGHANRIIALYFSGFIKDCPVSCFWA